MTQLQRDTSGRDTLAALDRIAHDPAQTHLAEYLPGSRGPYPAHPHGDDT